MRYLETKDDMTAYIERSRLSQHTKDYYSITGSELNALFDILQNQRDPYGALCLAFSIGRAKGYRAAKNGK